MKNLILMLTLIGCSQFLCAQTIQSEIQKIAGQYAGEWTSYKMDPSGSVIKSMSWKDTLTAGDPVINDTLAYVNVKSVMTFDNPAIHPYKFDFKEGFKLKNGTIVSHFYAVMGTEVNEIKVDTNTYIISQPVSAYELNQMGFKNVIQATNTTLKVPIIINGAEVDKITRITTVIWKENEQIVTKQFTSMEGYHKKIKNQ